MTDRRFMEVNEAVAEAAVQAGCRFFAGYPITPATQILEYMSRRLPEVGGVFVNAASEIEAVAMVYGAAGAGARAMIATSSTAFSLMQEQAAAIGENGVPVVMVNMCRYHLQGDYYQATRGGGTGDYRQIVLAPSTGQEAVDLTMLAFHLADKWRIGVVLLGDTVLAHTSETVEFAPLEEGELPPKDWATTGAKGRPPRYLGVRVFGSFQRMADSVHSYTSHGELPAQPFNPLLDFGPEKLAAIASAEARHEAYLMEGAEIMLVAYGTAARFARPVVEKLRGEGVPIGMVRPITLWPYPYQALAEAAAGVSQVLVYELNLGQMVDDVRIAVEGRAPVTSIAHVGTHAVGFGYIDTPDIIEEIVRGALGRKEATVQA